MDRSTREDTAESLPTPVSKVTAVSSTIGWYHDRWAMASNTSLLLPGQTVHWHDLQVNTLQQSPSLTNRGRTL